MGEIGPRELRLMQGLAQEVTARDPALLNGDATVGELAWMWGQTFDRFHPFWRHRMWFVEDRLVGWGWAVMPHRIPLEDGSVRESKQANLIFQVHPDQPKLLNEILDWYDEQAGDVGRSVIIQSADTAALPIVVAHGFEFDTEAADDDDGDWVQFNSRDLVDVAEPVLPDGFRFVSAADVSVGEAVNAHRGAWHPVALRELDLERVQATWPYRPDLHVLVEAPDATLAATAIVWFDEANGTAEFEPVGTHRDHRRQGLGTALQLHGMRLARAAGATRMLVACAGANSDPAARDLYYGVGFQPITRDLPYSKVAS
ncbi:MAG: GNAT family N-acetyltransferase [Acidimicrobiales bacterium]